MSNYPCCMTRADWVHVGELNDTDEVPGWFVEQLEEDGEIDPEDNNAVEQAWNEYCADAAMARAESDYEYFYC